MVSHMYVITYFIYKNTPWPIQMVLHMSKHSVTHSASRAEQQNRGRWISQQNTENHNTFHTSSISATKTHFSSQVSSAHNTD